MSTESYTINPYLNSDTDKFDIDPKYIKKLILNYVNKINENVSPVDSKGRFGHLHSGDVGIAFMFLKLSQSKYLKTEGDYLGKARQYIQTAKRQIGKVSECCSSFLFGQAGVNAVAMVIANELNDKNEYKQSLENFLKDLEECSDPNYNDEEEACDEYFNGRAGFLSGIYWINNNITPAPISKEQINKITKAILKNGQQYAEENESPCPLMYSYYMGAAHGVSSAYLALLQTLESEGDKVNFNNIKESVDYLVQHQDEDGHFAISFSGAEEDSGEERMIRFTHGAPGIIYLLIKAFLTYKDEKYLVAAKTSADAIWEKGLIETGNSISEGIIGNAYTFLAMYRLTQDRKYLYRASKFLEFTQSDNYPFKNNEESFTLFNGIAGIVCFLVDLLEPEKSYFPFMNVF